ncbi:MAG TPA: adenine deaminase [Methanocorpusculum sp.]|nr:adenine deaminase [Methanocorpusculum sp.]
MIVFDNALIFNPADCTWNLQSFSIENGRVLLISEPGAIAGDDICDMKGKRVVPGLIDTHVHIESSLLTPKEFGRLILSHGVTTAVCDPHEIANVAGTSGIDFMLKDAEMSPADLFFMIPSCVPATPTEVGGAVLYASDILKYKNNPKVLGLGEMMNVPGVLADDQEVLKKLGIFSHVDGHAPGLSGNDLCRYIAHGIKTDHECTTPEEAREKIRLGMFVLLREGNAAKNVAALTPAVTKETMSRCAFATDDRHADSLERNGSIDKCIRVAQKAGMPLEIALRLATLSAAECMGLLDRGILAPGKIADFCVLADGDEFRVKETYKEGILSTEIIPDRKTPEAFMPSFNLPEITADDLELPEGNLKVIEVLPESLITETGIMTKHDDGVNIITCIDRYRGEKFSVCAVHGLNIRKGAVASSISHDAHNIIAAGASKSDLLKVINAVKKGKGGMAVCIDGKVTLLPLPVGGLMTDEPYETVCKKLDILTEVTGETDGVRHLYMRLSFLGLTVIPHLKITPRGLFDGDAFTDTDMRV